MRIADTIKSWWLEVLIIQKLKLSCYLSVFTRVVVRKIVCWLLVNFLTKWYSQLPRSHMRKIAGHRLTSGLAAATFSDHVGVAGIFVHSKKFVACDVQQHSLQRQIFRIFVESSARLGAAVGRSLQHSRWVLTEDGFTMPKAFSRYNFTTPLPLKPLTKGTRRGLMDRRTMPTSFFPEESRCSLYSDGRQKMIYPRDHQLFAAKK